MSHHNDFPDNHDMQRTRTHARPRPAQKSIASQAKSQAPANRADAQSPSNARPRPNEPRMPRKQPPAEPGTTRKQPPAELGMPCNQASTGSRTPHEQTAADSRTSRNQKPAARTMDPSKPPKAAIAIVGTCLVLALVAFGIVHWQSTKPIDIIVNGQALQLPRAATVNDAFEAAGSPATAGNMLDIDGELLQEGGGTAYSATLDGQALDPITAAATPLDGHASLDFSNGADVEEPSHVAENQPLAHGVQDIGHGPLHIIAQQGQNGSGTIKTGEVSGKQQVIEVASEPVDTVMKRCYPDTGGEKVVALTFDDGPWDDTNELLDVLRDNGAKATFFTVGNRISGSGVDIVKREVAEGHQVATHTWDHAAGEGQSVNLSYMSAEQQREEITKGFQAIEDATGQKPSFVMRAPGGNFPTEVWSNVEDLVVADIGWDVDTTDWKRPEASRIAAELTRVTPGDIVLMHDGGGNRENTIEGLRIALPKLAQDGWKFVTIDELMKYPTKDS